MDYCLPAADLMSVFNTIKKKKSSRSIDCEFTQKKKEVSRLFTLLTIYCEIPHINFPVLV